MKRLGLTDYRHVVWRLVVAAAADAGGPLQLSDDVTPSLDLGYDVTDHVTADDRHVGGQTAQPQHRRAVDRGVVGRRGGRAVIGRHLCNKTHTQWL